MYCIVWTEDDAPLVPSCALLSVVDTGPRPDPAPPSAPPCRGAPTHILGSTVILHTTTLLHNEQIIIVCRQINVHVQRVHLNILLCVPTTAPLLSRLYCRIYASCHVLNNTQKGRVEKVLKKGLYFRQQKLEQNLDL